MLIYIHPLNRWKDDAKILSFIQKHGFATRVRASVETMSENYVAKQIKALVGFEVVISEVHGSKKLSQNRDDINHQKIVENLKESIVPLDKEVAEEMKKERSDSLKVLSILS